MAEPCAGALPRRCEHEPVGLNRFAEPSENRTRGFEVFGNASMNPKRSACLVQINSATSAEKVDKVTRGLHFFDVG